MRRLRHRAWLTGKKCGRCSTRYCGPECQVQHWKEGGHDKLCKKIKKQAAPNSTTQIRKYAEAVAVAVGARRNEGPDVLHLHASPPLEDEGGPVRMCSCRGTAGFAHVSCLAEQAKILSGGRGNHLDHKVKNARWHRWDTCSLCEQDYHGVVRARSGGRVGRRTWAAGAQTGRRDALTWERFTTMQNARGRVDREEASWL